MTLGIGSVAKVSSSALCRPAWRETPLASVVRKTDSALPSPCTYKRSGPSSACGQDSANCWRPTLPRRLSSASVGFPSLNAMLDGINFWVTSASAATALTALMCAARRRGVAYGVTTECSLVRPSAFRFAASDWANDSPSLFNALGGNSSANSSTSRLLVLDMLRPPSLPSRPASPRPTLWAPSGSRAAPGCRDNFAPPRAPDCECGRCRPRAR